MTAPFVGPATVGGAGCAYSGDIDQPACGAPPITHLLVDVIAWGVVALSACGAHVGIARATGAVMDEHAHLPGCDETHCWGLR